MRKIIQYILIFLISTNVAYSQCAPGTWSLNVTINPDQYPEETSWYIMDFFWRYTYTGWTLR